MFNAIFQMFLRDVLKEVRNTSIPTIYYFSAKNKRLSYRRGTARQRHIINWTLNEL